MDDSAPTFHSRPRLVSTRTHPLRDAVAPARVRRVSTADLITPVTLLVALCMFGALFPWEAFQPQGERMVWDVTNMRRTAAPREVSAQFAMCLGTARTTCVVDGDTIWLEGQEIRIADIDAPEVSQPACAAEREAGLSATAALMTWLNAGEFEVRASPDDRDADTYGRKLRVLSRGGESAVDALVAEGVARRTGAKGKRWC